MATTKKWYSVLKDKKTLPEGRVQTVTAGHQGICLTHYKGKFSALDNKCPHQGGPLGEGSIENGMLRCPWHGWDFDPCTGTPPGGFDDGVKTFEVKEEDDEIFIAIDEEEAHQDTISDVMIETMVNWGVNTGFGMVGHSNLAVANAMMRQEEQGNFQFSSESNKTKFEASPEAFAPQYGGFCAIAMSEDAEVNPNPKSWEVRDGKLYFFTRMFFGIIDAKRQWVKDPLTKRDLADAAWVKMNS